jgi:flagellar protein FlgJ
MSIDTNAQAMFDALRATAGNATMKTPDKDADLREAAEQFEAIFLNEFIKQARKAKLAEDLFASSAKSTYQDMMDQELSKNLSGRVNLGIAEALVRQLGGGK